MNKNHHSSPKASTKGKPNAAVSLIASFFGSVEGFAEAQAKRAAMRFRGPTPSRAERKDRKAPFGRNKIDHEDGTTSNVKAKPWPGFVQRKDIPARPSARRVHREQVALNFRN